MKIRNLMQNDFQQIVQLSDRVFGADFLTLDDGTLNSALKDDVSFILQDENEKVVGYRLTFSPGNWIHHFETKTDPQLWPIAADRVAYFKTICIDPSLKGKGWGKKLSDSSIQSLKTLGALGIICHSWKEEPNDASRRYLERMGFAAIVERPMFWNQLDYDCAVCTPKRCECTAIEMLLKL